MRRFRLVAALAIAGTLASGVAGPAHADSGAPSACYILFDSSESTCQNDWIVNAPAMSEAATTLVLDATDADVQQSSVDGIIAAAQPNPNYHPGGGPGAQGALFNWRDEVAMQCEPATIVGVAAACAMVILKIIEMARK